MSALRLIVFASFLSITFWGNGLASQNTPLDQYVDRFDPSYAFAHTSTRHKEGYSVFVVQMTSQRWRSPTEVDRTLWEHELLIVVPWVTHSGNDNNALLIVNGGSNSAPPTTENDQLLGALATATGSVAAMVSQIPNQRLTFADELDSRIEDELLAYGMDKFLDTGDPEWLIQLPMTKAVVRAMDTIQTFADQADFAWPTVPRIDDFIVLGGSKRGWATWLTAAVEARKGAASRIRAIVPISIDLLNLDEQFIHHWNAYGFYAPAIEDYAALNLPCRALTPAGQAMLEIIDPYEYRDRLTMPKLILNSAGDQFFLPDSAMFYYDALPEPKHLRYTFNTDHAQSQDLEAIILPTLSWLSEKLDDEQGPQFSWTIDPDGSIRVQAETKPDSVRLWQATNPNARDFRLAVIGPAWTSSKLQEGVLGEYVGYVPPPANGWGAFGVELTFPGATAIPTPLESDQVFTTTIAVTPAVLPFQEAGGPCGRYQAPAWVPKNSAKADHEWTFVGAPAFFANPVVITGPPTYFGSDPAVVRVRNITDRGFQLRVNEWEYKDGSHLVEDIPFVLLDAGRHVMSDGSVWQAGAFELGGTGDWASVSFANAFQQPPHMFLTVQTYNGQQAVSVRARNVTASGFEAALFEEESLMDGHVTETVGFLAIHSPQGGGMVDLDGEEVPYLLQTVTADHRWLPVLSQRLKLEEEQSFDNETSHVDETVQVLALGNQVFAQQVSHNGPDTTALRRLPPTSEAAMEWGLIRGVDHNWQTLPFAKTYADPVIIAKPASNFGADPGVIRLRKVAGDMTELRYQEWTYLDDWHTREDVFYLVTDAGQQTLGGLTVQADWLQTGKLGRAGQWEGVTFNPSFGVDPIVLSSVMTYNGVDTVTTRIRGLANDGFQIAMDEEEARADGHVTETLGWVAIQPGFARTSDGRALDVFFTSIDHQQSTVPYRGATPHRHPSVITEIDSTYGSDPVFLRYTNPTSLQVTLNLDEEQSQDAETSHVAEDIGAFVAE